MMRDLLIKSLKYQNIMRSFFVLLIMSMILIYVVPINNGVPIVVPYPINMNVIFSFIFLILSISVLRFNYYVLLKIHYRTNYLNNIKNHISDVDKINEFNINLIIKSFIKDKELLSNFIEAGIIAGLLSDTGNEDATKRLKFIRNESINFHKLISPFIPDASIKNTLDKIDLFNGFFNINSKYVTYTLLCSLIQISITFAVFCGLNGGVIFSSFLLTIINYLLMLYIAKTVLSITDKSEEFYLSIKLAADLTEMSVAIFNWFLWINMNPYLQHILLSFISQVNDANYSDEDKLEYIIDNFEKNIISYNENNS